MEDRLTQQQLIDLLQVLVGTTQRIHVTAHQQQLDAERAIDALERLEVLLIRQKKGRA